MTKAYSQYRVGVFALVNKCRHISGFFRYARSGRQKDFIETTGVAMGNPVVGNDFEPATTVLPEELDQVIYEGVVVVDD